MPARAGAADHGGRGDHARPAAAPAPAETRNRCSELRWKRSVDVTISTPSRTSATMLSTVWETRVPSSTGNVSRTRPIRRAMTIARAGSPRRAGSVADISTPTIVAEVKSRRRSGAARQRRAGVEYQAAARKNIDAHHQRGRDQDPGEVRADGALDHAVDADPLRRDERQPDADDAGRRRARPGARSAAPRCRAGPAPGRARAAAGPAPAAGRRPARGRRRRKRARAALGRLRRPATARS